MIYKVTDSTYQIKIIEGDQLPPCAFRFLGYLKYKTPQMTRRLDTHSNDKLW